MTANISRNKLISDVRDKLMAKYVDKWYDTVNRESGSPRVGRNKLRTYRLFKAIYEQEKYYRFLLPLSHRAAFAKFSCRVAPIRIETGRFKNLDVSLRLCHICNVVENEAHVMLECSAYNDLRDNLFHKTVSVPPNFIALNVNEKMQFLFSNSDMIRVCDKTGFEILQQRSSLFYKQNV